MKEIEVGTLRIGSGIPKICVSIFGRTEEEIRKSAEDAKESKADMVELRIDYYENVCNTEGLIALVQDVKRIVRDKPLLFTFRTRKEGGQRAITKEEYIKLNCAIAESTEVDLLDVELFMGEDVSTIVECAHRNKRKVIFSNHDFLATPEKSEMIGRLKRMEELGADILKIAVFPQKKEDVLTLLSTEVEMERLTEKPVIAISMGQEGMVSRFVGEIFGSCITFAAIKETSAPGQIQVNLLREILSLLHKKEDNLFFIGFMGAGKSSVARAVAEKKAADLIEIDEELSCIAGMEISAIFERYGEEYFRDMESSFLKRIEGREGCVVSCGGGAPIREENVHSMKSGGRIVYLRAKPETIYERVKDSETRPILNGNMNVSYIRSLMDQRNKRYEEIADFIIDTDDKNIDAICAEICKN